MGSHEAAAGATRRAKSTKRPAVTCPQRAPPVVSGALGRRALVVASPARLDIRRYGIILRRIVMNRLAKFMFVAGLLTNATVRADSPPLIPRDILFGNPERTSPALSPDGQRLAWLAPDTNNVLQVWVKTVGKQDDKIITADKKRGIRQYLWAMRQSHPAVSRRTATVTRTSTFTAWIWTLETCAITLPFKGSARA